MSRAVRYLLDTNVISETRKIRADKCVMSFPAAVDEADLLVSALTIGELYKGVEIKRRAAPDDAEKLAKRVDGIERTFGDRIVPIDATVARRWGELSSDRSRPVVDTLIAATAYTQGLTLATRNIPDISGSSITTIDPWKEKP